MLIAKDHVLIETLLHWPNTSAVTLQKRGNIIDLKVEVNNMTEAVKDEYLALYCHSVGDQEETRGHFVIVEASNV